MSCRETLLEDTKELIDAIVKESNLENKVKEFLSRDVRPLDLRKGIVLVSIGKGALSMAKGALSALGDKIVGGVVATTSQLAKGERRLESLEIVAGSHPVPDEKSLRAAEAVLEWSREAKSSGGLLALISGGGSAIVEKPLEPLALNDIIVMNKLLLNSGASIREINTVRKHLSAIKGGRLAEVVYPAPLLGLYASDVPGDKLEDIASGPTVPDPTTYADALHILEIYDLKSKAPKNVVELLENGLKGFIRETPKPGNPIFSNTKNVLVAKNLDILNSLERILRNKGYNVLKLTSRIEGESKETAKVLASIALEANKYGVPSSPPLAILFGGETSVTVRGEGLGGRNQELVLAWASRVYYWEGSISNMIIMALDTDGIDGITDAAGAYAFPEDIENAKKKGLDPDTYLKNNDSYTLLKKLNRLIVTGPTGSNLNSVGVLLIKKC